MKYILFALIAFYPLAAEAVEPVPNGTSVYVIVVCNEPVVFVANSNTGKGGFFIAHMEAIKNSLDAQDLVASIVSISEADGNPVNILPIEGNFLCLDGSAVSYQTP